MHPEDLLDELADELGYLSVHPGDMLGTPALQDTDGAEFVCLHNHELACRLHTDTPSYAKAMELTGAHVLDPLLPDWVSIPEQHADRWVEFAADALARVQREQ